ncbi:hypothetical protein JGI7_01414 [Candidatus Kryptonium thompsonii]|jgi:hypothetical protein|uniref:Uncharacterized protein n=2 Tax=Candidatus Kryptonium thompsonii TaxID=1633631 RepID=A0A0P1P480_9BACT|nr:hypothetical protein [Candidatus Kryptonium thompsoni]CUS77745.1 hypothetical protein JGI16_10079 [Candidatus Kryptonium thompsoni]CUS79384.1 hypothetical protein JGI12_00290 [Candidatus Kryptonium thompsoni]CUS81583.1 hypothetical protein JGI15_101124 [Candidatus Kryptonium thompsoni]CUS83638.1 hypothetical protein JGI10_00921 [Candidatus Kryptonium thompsoni]CUS86742.1 hypothetical protein JGI8_01032 [Candidatus Kryptonium thompsoni]
MSSLLDYIMATIIGGAILLITITVTDTGTREFLNYNSDAITQINLANTSGVIEYDLRKMGYGIPEGSQILFKAEPGHIKFIAHLNREFDYFDHVIPHKDNVPDTIEYVISLAETIDYGDTILRMYKVTRILKITGEGVRMTDVGRIGNARVFRYLDQIGNPVDPGMELIATKMVEVTLTMFNPRVVLSPELVKKEVSSIQDQEFRKRELRRLLRTSFWRQTRLVSKNLRR